MAVQNQAHVDYQWLTVARIRVLRELSEEFTERQVAERLRMAFPSVRSAIEAVKGHTGCHDERAIRRWWREHRTPWARWVLAQAGLTPESIPAHQEKVPEVS